MRRFLTFDLLVHLSDRDYIRIVETVDTTTLLHAYKNTSPKYLQQLTRAFTDRGNESIQAQLTEVGQLKDEEVQAARERMAEIADRLLTEDDMEDWHIRKV